MGAHKARARLGHCTVARVRRQAPAGECSTYLGMTAIQL